MTELYIKETCAAAIMVTFHPATAICINVQELEDSGGVCIPLWFFLSSNQLPIKAEIVYKLFRC